MNHPASNWSRRSILAGSLIAVASGCTPTTPTTQPVANPSAAQALANIQAAEAIAMVGISVAYNANLIPASDYAAAVTADKAFQVIATGLGADIAAGKPITATDVGDALSAALAAIVTIHAKAAAAKAAAKKA